MEMRWEASMDWYMMVITGCITAMIIRIMDIQDLQPMSMAGGM